VKELVALLKAKPGAYNYGSSGNGTILHLAAEMFFDEAGVSATHVPYKGVGPMLTDLIGGQVDIGALSLPSVQQHLKNGTLRAIGVGTAKRLAAAPEIPTMIEQGLPGYLVEGWFAVIGRPGCLPRTSRGSTPPSSPRSRRPRSPRSWRSRGTRSMLSTPERPPRNSSAPK
jgi:tripartite-type tricarboxylate transporter receptor subunit TctC